jgi:pyruvate dehydrogenase E2 component (dihydrolipoamide acetyltransferase)
VQSIYVPDIGGASNVRVIEILVKPGEVVDKDTSIITLESEKASMEIPAPMAGTVKELKIKVGDTISEGDEILTLTTMEAMPAAEKVTKLDAAPAPKIETVKPVEEKKVTPPPVETPIAMADDTYAGPASRKLARELGIDLHEIGGSGRRGRVTSEDIQRHVKNALSKAKNGGSGGLPTQPHVDFTKYGAVEEQPLNRIKKLSGANLQRNWVLVPHVTQFGEADITEMEEFRNTQKEEAQKAGVKMTPLLFLMKAVVAALKRFPQFNASLDTTGEKLILKKYFHIGVAVDTPNGLVVPVIRNVDQKGLFALARELAEVSERARTKGLMLNEMEGSCFTISSLGGIGGTAFTPIVNVPDVAILGVSRAEMKPVYQNGTFVPRLKLPLSLSYDHRVIDGADGARFTQYLCDLLGDLRRLLL